MVGNLSYFSEGLKYMKIMSNLNWIGHYIFSGEGPVNDSEGWGLMINLALVLLGELFVMKIILGSAVCECFIGLKDSRRSLIY